MTVYSQYISGNQIWAGTITGSDLGVSGLNPVVDRLNSISDANSAISANTVSGTATSLFVSGGQISTPTGSMDFVNKSYIDNVTMVNFISGVDGSIDEPTTGWVTVASGTVNVESGNTVMFLTSSTTHWTYTNSPQTTNYSVRLRRNTVQLGSEIVISCTRHRREKYMRNWVEQIAAAGSLVYDIQVKADAAHTTRLYPDVDVVVFR